ncbi:MAG: hypothetical protein JSV11_11045 [Nitrospiraceae bacterium]|nr:MAG: hypothetical protein JSV11_11045 [Nitrospiraceae bacterium]
MHAAGIWRSTKAVFDPWELYPTITAKSLTGLGEAMIASVDNKGYDSAFFH